VKRSAFSIPPDLRLAAPRDHRLAAWLALLAILALGLAWGAHQPYSWDADNIAPGPVLRGIAQRFGPGWYSSYGPVPYYLVAMVYIPLLGFFKMTGELGTPSAEYPWGFDHPDASMAALIIAARVVSLLLAIPAAWTLVRAAFPPESGVLRRWIVPVLLIGSPVFVYYARTTNVDMHYFAWLALGFLLVQRRESGPAGLAGAGACAVVAVCSKEQAAPFAAVILATAFFRALFWESRPRVQAIAGLALASAGAYAASWMLPLNLAGWRRHHDFIFHVAKYDRAYPLTIEGFRDLGGRLLELTPVALGWPAILGLTFALVFRASWRGLGPRAIACGIYLLGFIGPIGYVYPRFLLPLLLLVIPLAARGWNEAFERVPAGSVSRLAFAAILLVFTLTGGPNLTVVQLTDARYAVQHWLKTLPPGATVEVAGNARFQARMPHEARVIYTTMDSLRVRPHGPRGDVVLLSSLDEAFFRRDPAIQAVFWDSLAGPGTAYRPPLWFRPARNTGNILNLFVSPTTQAYVRKGVPLRLEPAR